MIYLDINFLRQRRKKIQQVEVADKRLAYFVGYVLISVVVVAGISVALTFWFSSRIQAVVKEQRDVTNQIGAMSQLEAEYLTIAQKASAITVLMKNKSAKQEAVEYFSQIFAQYQADISELDFTDDDSVEFHITTPDIFNFDPLLVRLRSDEVRLKYPLMTVSNVARTKAGAYVVEVSVKLAKPEPVKPKPTLAPLE